MSKSVKADNGDVKGGWAWMRGQTTQRHNVRMNQTPASRLTKKAKKT